MAIFGTMDSSAFAIESVLYYDSTTHSIKAADIHIEDGIINYISRPKTPTKAKSLLCLPGLVNAHLHPSKEIYRGIYEPTSSNQLMDAVHINNRSESKTTQSAATLVALADCLLNGVTTVGIFTSRPDVDAMEARRIGIRSAVFYSQNDGWTGRGVAPDNAPLGQILANFDRVFSLFDSDLITINPATASEFTASDTLIKFLHRAAKKLNRRFCMHLHEGKRHVDLYRSQNQLSAIQYLSSMNVMNCSTTLVHTSFLSENDIREINSTDVNLVHCPISNSFTSAGKMPLSRLFMKHTIGLGTDSAMINPISNLAFEALFTSHFHGEQTEAEKVSPQNVMGMITDVGARAINFHKCGRIEAGMQADICLFDNYEYSDGDYNVEQSVLLTYLNRRPRHVLVSGRPVVTDFRLHSSGVEPARAKVAEARSALIERFSH